jgi:hypothetical protein
VARPDVSAVTVTAASTTVVAATFPPTTAEPAPPLAINHIQVIGSHNSFHLKPQPLAFEAITAVSPELAESIEYSHRPLTEQLEQFGIRQFELDVFADPDGGLYANRAANAVIGLDPIAPDPELQVPGYKVLHTQDFDYETTCLTLVICLTEIEAWSSEHPDHLPVMIMLEIKTQSVPEAAAADGLVVAAGHHRHGEHRRSDHAHQPSHGGLLWFGLSSASRRAADGPRGEGPVSPTERNCGPDEASSTLHRCDAQRERSSRRHCCSRRAVRPTRPASRHPMPRR